MKRSYIFIGGFLIFILIITIVGSNIVTGNTSIKKEKDILSVQSNKEVYFNGYGYSLDNPNVIINPYGNSPLTGIAMLKLVIIVKLVYLLMEILTILLVRINIILYLYMDYMLIMIIQLYYQVKIKVKLLTSRQ